MDSTQARYPNELRFDKADVTEASTGPLVCHACQGPLHNIYFEVDAQPSCEKCRYELESERNHGSGPGRFARALVAGGFAGLVGAGIYYAVLALTGYEVGLVAIVVGVLVGFGVRWGSRGRGGWPYQVLAVAITYVAIVSTYVPFIFEEIQNLEATEVAETSAPGVATEATVETPTDATAVPANGGQPAALGLEEELTAGQAVAALALFSVFVLAIPFLGGFQNILGILIIGFGLYQAWKINARHPLVIEGPFQVGKIAPALSVTPLEPAAT